MSQHPFNGGYGRQQGRPMAPRPPQVQGGIGRSQADPRMQPAAPPMVQSGFSREYEQRLLQMHEEKHREEMEALRLEKLWKQAQLRGEMFPEQFRAGVIKYQDRYPFPMLYNQEALDNAGDSYANALTEYRATFNIDVQEPTYLYGIDFGLIMTAGNRVGTNLNNCYLPLNGSKGSDVFVPVDSIYPGLDFDWEVETSADDQMWQHGLRPSSICKSEYGYRLPIEYELNKNEVLTVKATPRRVKDNDEAPILYVLLHCYKMKKRVV